MSQASARLLTVLLASLLGLLASGGIGQASSTSAQPLQAGVDSPHAPASDLSGANLSGANLSGTKLNGVNFGGADLTKVDFSGADLTRADLRQANLTEANLRGATLHWTDLTDCIYDETTSWPEGFDPRTNSPPPTLRSGSRQSALVDLKGADLSGANLGTATLIRANLGGANLSRANLRDANLSGASLRAANLTGADLSRAKLHLTDLTGCIFSPTTEWPAEFDAVGAGCRLASP